ncbi:MAG: hypothetical protein ACLUSN_05945 [Blautia wexlerae]
MGRLIDADELIKYIKIWEIGTSISSDQKEFIDCINEQFTVFNVNKVVESLENGYRDVSSDEDLEWNRAIDYAIKIVKEGGNDPIFIRCNR